MTWAQVDALMNRSYQREKRTFGELCATIANCAPFVKKDKVYTPDHFFPDHRKVASDSAARTEAEHWKRIEEQTKWLTSIFGCGPGKPGTVQ